MVETNLTTEELRRTCLKKCGCCVEENGKIRCLSIGCIYGFWEPADLD